MFIDIFQRHNPGYSGSLPTQPNQINQVLNRKRYLSGERLDPVALRSRSGELPRGIASETFTASSEPITRGSRPPTLDDRLARKGGRARSRGCVSQGRSKFPE